MLAALRSLFEPQAPQDNAFGLARLFYWQQQEHQRKKKKRAQEEEELMILLALEL